MMILIIKIPLIIVITRVIITIMATILMMGRIITSWIPGFARV